MIIAVANQKGGQGKTTTAQAIVTGAAQIGKKALAIDLDAQGNLTFSMGGNAADVGAYELITGKAAPEKTVQRTAQGDIITASLALASADITLTGNARTEALKTAIRPLVRRYDVIVIDCPPALNTLLINALTAADKVIIPLTADMYSLQGLYLLAQTIRETRQKHNTGLEIGGVLFVKHNTRTVLARDLADVIKEKCSAMGVPVYNTVIREGVAVREAQTQRQSIFDYAPRSNPAKDYKRLIEEIGL